MNTSAEVTTADELLGRLRNPDFVQVRTVPLFIGPNDLVQRLEALEDELESARSTSIGLESDVPRLVSEIDAVNEELAQYEFKFKVRALARREWSDLLAAHPPTKEQKKSGERVDFNPETFPQALLSACLVHPKMTVEQVEELSAGGDEGGGLTDAQFNVLFNAAVYVSQSGVSVPKSRAADAIRLMSRESSPPPITTESLDPSSSAE